jgi:hypothetical protein
MEARIMSDGGKGSRPRPFSVSNQEYAQRWDAIFRRDLPEEKKEQPLTEQKDEQTSGEQK